MRKIIFSDDISIFVPDSLKKITTYILLEQLDWFEDEIKFLKKFIVPGNNVIDIGANYGVYTLTLAKLIGDKGHIYSFEPCTETRKFLESSMDVNSFKNITIDSRGLSDKKKEAILSLSKNSETNSVANNSNTEGEYEKIILTDLDSCKNFYKWNNIDFIKIDAEGQESNIIKGGKEFFLKSSPLVQYEVKDKANFNLDLINEFKSIGYDTYRLIPGLDILTPWDDIEFDEFILNLFCCKKDTAEKLANKNILIKKDSLVQKSFDDFDLLYTNLISENNFYDHIDKSIPYFNFLNSYWKNSKNLQNTNNQKAIFLYFISQNNQNSSLEKYQALKYSFQILSKECKINSGNARLSSLARISGELGLRSIQVSTLIQLRDAIYEDKILELGEIFLLPEKYQEQSSLKHWDSEISNWMISNILTTIEKKEYFSSFFSQDTTLGQLQQIKDLGYSDKEIDRRINLIKLKFKD